MQVGDTVRPTHFAPWVMGEVIRLGERAEVAAMSNGECETFEVDRDDLNVIDTGRFCQSMSPNRCVCDQPEGHDGDHYNIMNGGWPRSA